MADNGPGIPPEYHEVIFRKFERVKQPNIPRDAQLGTRPRVLQAGRRGARRPDLGEQRGGEGEPVPYRATVRSDDVESRQPELTAAARDDR